MRSWLEVLLVSTCCVISLIGCRTTPNPDVSFQHGAVTIPYKEALGGRPVIEGVVNGVRGRFLVDTGCDDPVLTIEAVRRCGIPVARKSRAAEFLGQAAPGEFTVVDGDVRIEIDGAIITWKGASVASGLGSDEFFGIIDYRTLKASHAVIDTAKKTLTIFP